MDQHTGGNLLIHGTKQREANQLQSLEHPCRISWNSYHCAFEDSRSIITKFGTRHDSRTVVTCTKFRYDRPTIIEIRGTRIFSKFWIRSNLSIRYLVGQAPGYSEGNMYSAIFQQWYQIHNWFVSMPTATNARAGALCTTCFGVLCNNPTNKPLILSNTFSVPHSTGFYPTPLQQLIVLVFNESATSRRTNFAHS